MDGFLRQSTAVDLPIGPFLDATDGVTAETGLTIAQADVRLKKNNGAWAQINDNTSATHEENGWYEKEFDATDTNTVGILKVAIHEAGALPVFHTFQILEEAVYDALFAASALGYVANAPVNVAQISGDSTAADNLELAFDDTAGAVPWLGITDQGTAQSATSTTLVLRAATPFGADNSPIGSTLWAFGSTQGYWQCRLITDYVTSTDTATVDTWDVTPSGTITYKVFGTAPSSGAGAGLDAAGVRAAIGLASANLDTQLSTIDTVVDSILVDTAVIGSTGQGLTSLATQASVNTIDDFLDTEVAAILAAVDTEVAAILADTNELQTDWVNGGRLDLLVDGIKAKTDSLTFTQAGHVDANVQRINDVTITGNGQTGTEFSV